MIERRIFFLIGLMTCAIFKPERAFRRGLNVWLRAIPAMSSQWVKAFQNYESTTALATGYISKSAGVS
jgi:hypothetical protein